MLNKVTSLFIVCFLFLGSNAIAQEDFDVLFSCDVSVQKLSGTFDPATDTLDVRGSFNGWSGPSDILAPNAFNEDLYETIVRVNLTPVADTAKYKFVITNASGTVWETRPDRDLVATGDETDLNEDGVKDLILETSFFDDVSPDDIFTEETDIVFSVDMAPAIAYLAENDSITFGGETVTAIDFVILASGVTGTDPEMAWYWDLPQGDPLREALKMNDDGSAGDAVAGDDVWSLTVTMNPGAATSWGAWKYGINGFDNEAGFAKNHSGDVSNSPVFRVFGSNDTLYNDVTVVRDPEDFDVLFSCDVSVQKLSGTFDPANDTLDVRGSFNGWSGPTDILSPNAFNEDLYETIVRVNLTPIADTAKYKFVITNASGTVWETRPDRDLSATGGEPDLNEDGVKDLVLPTYFFDDVSPDDIFTEETDIVFEVDMSPAIAYLAQNDSITFGGETVTAIDFVILASGVTGTDPEMAWYWDLPQGDPLREALKMNDDGTDGDATAGDDIWSLTVTMNPGAATNWGAWKHGINGFDNEAGFAKNHSGDVSVSPVFREFGSNDTLYSGVTSIENNDGNVFLPEGISLNQNYPNPFNPTTNIEFSVNKSMDVRLDIFDVTGRKVRSLVNSTFSAGAHTVTWNGQDDNGSLVSSGIYFYKLKAGSTVETRKMVLMK